MAKGTVKLKNTMNHQNSIISISSQKNLTAVPPDSNQMNLFTRSIVTYCTTDLRSERGKTFQIFRIGIVCFISVAALVAAALIVVQHFTDMNYMAQTSLSVLSRREQEELVVHTLQLETILTLLYLRDNNATYCNNSMKQRLRTVYNSTDDALNSLKWIPADAVYFMDSLNERRDLIINASIDNSYEYLDFYTSMVTAFDVPLAKELQVNNLYVYSQEMAAYDLLFKGKYYAGEEAAFYTFLHVLQTTNFHDMENIVKWRTKVMNCLEMATEVAYYHSTFNESKQLMSLSRLHFTTLPLSSLDESPYTGSGNFTLDYYHIVKDYLEQFLQIQTKWREQILQKVQAQRASVNRYLSLEIVVTLLLVITCPLLLYNVCNMTSWIHQYTQQLKRKTDELKTEKQRTEMLLYQMLPSTVADALLEKKPITAETFESVTIFFSDIVGFTSISAVITPLQVVEMLNNLYLCFDSRIDVYDVYKVETIGDAYMVVSGCPVQNGDKHTAEIATMALDLRSSIKQVVVPHNEDEKLRVRIGIHTGPCVAGIVGSKMPRYCLFGDTVNTASRMESSSLPNMIHMSEAAQAGLKEDTSFVIEKRGNVEIKGKGNMTTYWLISRNEYKEVNESMVCEWPVKRKGKKKKKKKATLTKEGSVDSTMSDMPNGGSSVALSEISYPSSPVPSIESSTSTNRSDSQLTIGEAADRSVSAKTELQIVSEHPETVDGENGEKVNALVNESVSKEAHPGEALGDDKFKGSSTDTQADHATAKTDQTFESVKTNGYLSTTEEGKFSSEVRAISTPALREAVLRELKLSRQHACGDSLMNTHAHYPSVPNLHKNTTPNHFPSVQVQYKSCTDDSMVNNFLSLNKQPSSAASLPNSVIINVSSFERSKMSNLSASTHSVLESSTYSNRTAHMPVVE